MANIAKVKLYRDTRSGAYVVQSVLGGYVFRTAKRISRNEAEVEGDIMEQELLDAGFSVEVEICA